MHMINAISFILLMMSSAVLDGLYVLVTAPIAMPMHGIINPDIKALKVPNIIRILSLVFMYVKNFEKSIISGAYGTPDGAF